MTVKAVIGEMRSLGLLVAALLDELPLFGSS